MKVFCVMQSHMVSKKGIDEQKFGKQWMVSKSALIREYGERVESE